MKASKYDDPDAIEDGVAKGRHRELIGGMWQELGALQLDFLRQQGLEPTDRLLDIGCGSLRAGVPLAGYLDAGNYWGTDRNESLLEAGYEIELEEAGLQERVPRSQLVTDDAFAFPGIDVDFDVALAQSLFTHLTLNQIRVCLERLPDRMRRGGAFFATFFEIPETRSTHEPFRHEPGGVVTHGAKDPYHYRVADFEFACRGLPWTVEYVGAWDHPRSQHMLRLVRDS